jgi:putative ABC transport system substrate-binding protein
LAARAQRTPVVGFLHYASQNKLTNLTEAARQGLKEVGYVEGQNVVSEYRWAEEQYDQLPELATNLVKRQVDVIVAGGNVAAQAAKKATTTIPVVFTSGADPVAGGLVASLSHPGGNLTGMSLLAAEMAARRLEVIRDLLPHARAVAMITNPAYPGSVSEMAEVEAAGRLLGIQMYKAAASSAADIDTAFATIGELGVDAFTVGADGFFITRRDQFAALATH